MLDLQVVHIRNVAAVTSLDFVTMLRVKNVILAGLLDVLIDDKPTDHMVAGADEILVLLPEGSDEVLSLIHLRYEAADGSGYTTLVDGSNIGGPNAQVVKDHTVMQLGGEDFSNAVEVLVNGRAQEFMIASGTEILCTLPVVDQELRTIDVVVSQTRFSRDMFFKYSLTDAPRSTTGNFKAVSQFIKVLLTSSGSNVFNPNAPAGDLRTLLGTQTPSSNRQAILAKVALKVSITAAKFAAQQTRRNIPASERISRVDLVDLGFDEKDQTAAYVSLRIITFDQQTAIFGLLLDTIDAVAGAAADISG